MQEETPCKTLGTAGPRMLPGCAWNIPGTVTLDTNVFLAVLVAALLHAAWNSLIKVGSDPFSTICVATLTQAAIAVPVLVLVPAPAADAIPWIVASAVIHTGYKVFLANAYDNADLSQAYPLARGTAPIAVFLVTALLFGAVFSHVETVAVLSISTGVVLMAFKGQYGRPMSRRSIGYVTGTAILIASYTVVDGVGARVAGTPSGYIMWMVIGDAVGMLAFAVLVKGRSVVPSLFPVWRIGLGSGAMSLGSYWIAVWAFTVAPIALVAALRETSILFATVIAALLIREPVGVWRWISIGFIVVGVVLMRL